MSVPLFIAIACMLVAVAALLLNPFNRQADRREHRYSWLALLSIATSLLVVTVLPSGTVQTLIVAALVSVAGFLTFLEWRLWSRRQRQVE